jgi:hypothetical protein
MFMNRNEMVDTITLTAEQYQELIDARDHAIAMREVASGAMPVLSHDEAVAYLKAASLLSFWRKHRGHSQAALAGLLNISQPYLAQIESGKRVGDVNLCQDRQGSERPN